MSTTISQPDLASALDALDEIAPVLEEGARASETLGRLAPAAEEALRSTGLFRTWCPAELGGFDASIREGIEVVERVAAIETAAAWNLGVCTLGSGFAGAYLDDGAVAQVFGEGETLIAGQTAPIGRAVPDDGGLRVSGRWTFGSGIHLASWVKAGVTIEHPEGRREAALVVMPAEAVTVVDGSWEVAGLAGSGSYDYAVDGHHVPAGFWFGSPAAVPRRGGAAFSLPIPGQVVILHAGFALGVAERCLREVIELVGTKIRQYDTSPMAARAIVRQDLARHHALLHGARLHTYDVADRLYADAGTPAMVSTMREMRAAARHVTDVALDIATWAYRQGGGAALRLDHPLQRYLRDMLAATQHIYVDDQALTDFGADLLGVDPTPGGAP